MDPTDLITGSLTGQKVGNYSTDQLLGKGSMGEVYQGSHPILDKKVAIKILSEELSQYPELVSRFRREARAIARIKHPAIVEAFDFGNLEDGRCYYVMELLQGTNLATYMQAKGALPLAESLEIAIPLMEGLATAHESGFIHRDIKPDNIFLTQSEEGALFPKIIDFGIAKLKDPDGQGDSVVTRIDAVMGTPLYMSPEQAPGSTETVGPWSDIYSTAATLYHLMSGKPPFFSDNPLELMLMHSWSPPPPLIEINPEVPQAISDTIMKALSKKPADRFSTMQQFADTLRAAAEGKTVDLTSDDEAGAGLEDTVLDGEPLEEVTGVPLDDQDADARPDEEATGGRGDAAPAAAQQAAPPTPAASETTDADPDAAAETATDRGIAVDDEERALERAMGEDAGGSGGADDSEDRAAEPGDEEPPTLEQDGRGATETSLSGVASEMVMEAAPPDATLYRRRRPVWPWLLGGGAAVAAAVLGFVLWRGEETPAKKPARWLTVNSATRHGCGIREDGHRLYCWGRNNYGQLGTGDQTPRIRPTAVQGLGPVLGVATGGRHSCAIVKAGRTVRCWGKNKHGQLGNGTRTDRSAPVAVADLDNVIALSAGAEHTCALQEEGTLRCWGKNAHGQLGIGKTGPDQPRPAVIKDLRAVVSLAAGGYHSCALTANDSLFCWGKNDVGQLGVGDKATRKLPTKVQGLRGITRVDAAGAHTCALDRQGATWCWGDNTSGQLGDGRTQASAEPVRVQKLAKATRIAAGGGYLGGHTCAVTEKKQLYCWGHNLHGQLGQDSSRARLLQPTLVNGLGPVSRVTAGGLHTCAIEQGGQLLCFGRNEDGQLGIGSRADRIAPTPVTMK